MRHYVNNFTGRVDRLERETTGLVLPTESCGVILPVLQRCHPIGAYINSVLISNPSVSFKNCLIRNIFLLVDYALDMCYIVVSFWVNQILYP